MNKNEGFRAMLNIENIYEEVFTRKGMGIFMRMAWLHVKDESDEKDLSDISYKLMIEELINLDHDISNGLVKIKEKYGHNFIKRGGEI